MNIINVPKVTILHNREYLIKRSANNLVIKENYILNKKK